MTAKRQWSLLTALACVLVLVAGFLLLVKPQHTKAASITTQTSSVQSQIQALRAQLTALQEQQKNLAGQEVALARIGQQLPSVTQIPTLLRTLTVAAKSSGVDLENLAPGNPTVLTAAPVATTSPAATPAATASAAPAAITAPVAGVAMIPISLTLTGGYAQVESFLLALERLPRSMLITSFNLAYQKPATAKAGVATIGGGEITASISSEVFVATAPLGSTSTTH